MKAIIAALLHRLADWLHEPVPTCTLCGKECDPDGYCDPCAELAVRGELHLNPHAYDYIGLKRRIQP